MKKTAIILAAAVSLILSSCYLWNASMDNVVRTYNLQYGINYGYEYHQASFRLLKTGDSLIFTKTNDYDFNDAAYVNFAGDYSTNCTEVFRETTDSEPGSSFSVEYSLTDTGLDGAFYMDDGTALYQTDSTTDIVQRQTDNWGIVYYTTTLGAVKGDYGYKLNYTDQTLDVYNIGSWIETAVGTTSLETEGEDSSIALTGITYISSHEMMISGDLLVLRVDSLTDDFHGIIFYDISSPAAPSELARKEPEDISDYSYSTYYHLEGTELYIYGRNSDSGFFYIWDVADPTDIPAATDISAGMADFSDGTSYPHLISGKIAINYNIYEPCLNVYDFSDPDNIVTATEDPSQTWAPDMNRNYPWDSMSFEDDRIYIAAGNNVEVWQYSSGSLDRLAVGFVGVPLLGAYKFPGDPYIYALGYDTVNVVSVKY